MWVGEGVVLTLRMYTHMPVSMGVGGGRCSTNTDRGCTHTCLCLWGWVGEGVVLTLRMYTHIPVSMGVGVVTEDVHYGGGGGRCSINTEDVHYGGGRGIVMS